MEKLKQYKYIILIFVIISGLSFYWFELRPMQIRKYCNRISLVGWTKNGEINYTSCLHDNGLEK